MNARLALLIGLGALLVPGCGNGRPAGPELQPGTVAQVGSASIPRLQFTHFLRAECLKLERLHPVDSVARHDRPEQLPCARQYRPAKARVMKLLITARWYEQEARRRGVSIGYPRRARDLAGLQRQRFVGDSLSYEGFRRRTGLTTGDMRVLLQWLELREALVPGSADALDRLLRPRYRAKTSCLSGFAIAECGYIEESRAD